MKITLSLLISAMLPWYSVVWAGPPIDDQFSGLNWNTWCPCQINMAKAPIAFTPDLDSPGNYFAKIIADEASLGGNKCRLEAPHFECRPPIGSSEFTLYGFDKNAGPDLEAPDRPEPLGPSLIPLLKAVQQQKIKGFLLVAEPPNPHCDAEALRRAKAAGEENLCIQRQELRVQKSHQHLPGEAHFYSLRFRMPHFIEKETYSLRWVTAQWKHEPESNKYKEEFGEKWKGVSPFLAQRFDGGVLHVTVQDEHCRCVVASAASPGISKRIWRNGRARHCLSTRPDASEHSRCTPEFQVEYGPKKGELPSPRGQWVELKYRVQASRSGKAKIEVYDGKELVVRVTGKIGYDSPKDEGTCPSDKVSCTKFKVGHYREYMPFVHDMDIDWIRVEAVAK